MSRLEALASAMVGETRDEALVRRGATAMLDWMTDRSRRQQAEIERLRRDAERYQWLRSPERTKAACAENGFGPAGTVDLIFVSDGAGSAAMNGNDLDKAIDAAMEKANGRP